MGLLTDLGDYVKQYGWDKKVTGANAAVAKYDENGIMGRRYLVRYDQLR